MVPSYSIVPDCGDESNVPEVNFNGARAVVPDGKCNLAVGALTVIPTFPFFKTVIAFVRGDPFWLLPISKIGSVATHAVPLPLPIL